MPPYPSFFLVFGLVLLPFVSPLAPLPNPCNERCGDVPIPYPFHLNSSCGPPIPAFRLSCGSNSTLRLPLDVAGGLRIVSFLSSGSFLVDYSSNPAGSACGRWYADVNRSFFFYGSPFFAVTTNNMLRLYDCEDSTVCKAGCGKMDAGGGCEDGNRTNFGCCYPLSDGSVWKVGDELSAFSEYGCRGFSSWVAARRSAESGDGAGVAERGIEVEWAVPRGYRNGTGCADQAVVVNATAVKNGVRCACAAGFVGDGFAHGLGCFKSCSNDLRLQNGEECCKGKFCNKRMFVLVGILVSAFIVAVMIALVLLLRKPLKEKTCHLDPFCLPKILRNSCCTRQFTYEELNEATKRFDEQKLADIVDGTVQTGRLDDGSLVAIQRVKCQNRQNLRQVLQRVELLSRSSHRNIARIMGYCYESRNTMLVVHEHFSNGTLGEHLRREKGHGLSWYLRINIAAEVARSLEFLQYEISTPSYIEDLKTSDILLDTYFSAKIAGFKFLKSILLNGSCSYVVSRDAGVVYNFGLILLELITGSQQGDHLQMVSNIKAKKLSEFVDPYLGYSEQLQTQREQIDKLVDLAVQCLASKQNGGPRIVDVVNELTQILKDNMASSSSRIEPSLEVTFSTSSLLQMVSMSPDSMHHVSGGGDDDKY